MSFLGTTERNPETGWPVQQERPQIPALSLRAFAAGIALSSVIGFAGGELIDHSPDHHAQAQQTTPVDAKP